MQNLNIYLEKMIGEQIADREIDEALDLLQIVPEIQKQLDDPTASPENKEKIIQKIFPLQIRGLLKLLAAHCQVSELEMLKEEYYPPCRKPGIRLEYKRPGRTSEKKD